MPAFAHNFCFVDSAWSACIAALVAHCHKVALLGTAGKFSHSGEHGECQQVMNGRHKTRAHPGMGFRRL